VGVRRKSFEEMNCSVAQSLEVVGEWWTMLIVRDCFLGVTRFDDFQQRLGISRNILTERLDHLVAKGVLVKVAYQEHPVRYDYRLTDKGRDLWAVLTALREWGDRWEADDGPPVVIEHRGCGHQTTVVPTCSSCGERLDARSVRALAGPGAQARPAEALLPSRTR
jgi:DNA-binding HxlR family transcriptional regulator